MTTAIATPEGIWCDTQLTIGGTKVRCLTKTYTVGSTIVALSGSGAKGEIYLALLEKHKGALPPTTEASVALWGPSPDQDEPRAFGGVAVTDEGIFLIDCMGYSAQSADPWVVTGSGGDAALGALHAGARPEEAIRIASKVDDATNDIIHFTPKPPCAHSTHSKPKSSKTRRSPRKLAAKASS